MPAGYDKIGRAAPAPWLSLWESWRAISEPERAQAVTNFGKMRRLQLVTLSVMTLFPYLLLRTPSQSRLTPCQLTQRESQGAAAPPNLVHHPPSNRVTPSGVGLLPGWQSRHCPRVLSRPLSHGLRRASSPIGRAKRRLRRRTPADLPSALGGQLFLNGQINLCTYTTKIPVDIPVGESQNFQA